MDNEFIDDIVSGVKATHYTHRNVSMEDALSVQSYAYKKIKEKPERYSLFDSLQFDCVFFKRKSLAVDRLVLIKPIEEVEENGLLYRELSLLAESLDMFIDVLSSNSEQDFNEYKQRIKQGDILNDIGVSPDVKIAFPKVFIDPKYLATHSGINRRFQKSKLCPSCGEKLKKMATDQESKADKRIYLCSISDCGYNIVIPKT